MAMKIISTAPVDLLHFVQQFWGREKISLSPAGTDIQISIPVLIDNHVGSLGHLSRLVVYAKSPISLPSLSIGETKVYHRYRKPGCLCRAVAGVGTFYISIGFFGRHRVLRLRVSQSRRHRAFAGDIGFLIWGWFSVGTSFRSNVAAAVSWKIAPEFQRI